ncbi:MAG TPA: class I SAM-dependent methyltransferase [Tepidisphaeraceae bacterium]|nr:class I SAM-dependent methyltransferase [Tepidisphaeraceae bacterium]
MKRYKAVAQYYDADNERHAMLRHDVPFFLGQLQRGRRLDILEIAVGTGRAAIPMAQAGHRVVGVDYMADMVEIARGKRDGVGLTERELKLVRQDALKLDLGRKFDWACIFFNTLLAFVTPAEQDEVLQRVRKHLKPRGRFWADLFNPDHVQLARQVERGIDPATFFVPELGRTVYRTTDITRDMAKQVMHVTTRYKWFDAHGRARHEKFSFDMACIFPRELVLLMERNGFEMEKMWGNYDGSGFKDGAPRMIVRCGVA